MTWYKMFKQASSQRQHEIVLADYQRYVADSYTTNVSLTKLKNKVTVSLCLYHSQLGGVHWNEFWRYEGSQMSKAASCFEKVKSVVDQVHDEFSGTEIPTALLYTYFRENMRKIDPENKPSTRVPWIDWAKDHAGEKDWRNSIYGNRYPESDGF